MAAAKRDDNQIKEDRKLIAKWLVQSIPYRQMLKMLNEHNKEHGKDYEITSIGSIAYDVKAILEEWREERVELVDLVVDRELKKLDTIEKEMWEAWEKSKSGKTSKKYNVSGTSTDKTKEIKEESFVETTGDSRYMDKIFECINIRKDLLGYAAPKKVEFSGSVGVGVAQMSDEEMNKEKERILKLAQKTKMNDAGGQNNKEA